MRIIAGSARSLKLHSPPGRRTRPTPDRIRETLFNIIAPLVPGANVLDLFAGSGALGIEALSRGAAYAVFVENDAAACRTISDNLRTTGFAEQAQLLRRDAFAALTHLASAEMMSGRVFDLIFIDPPYHLHHEAKLLTHLADQPYISPDSLIILETATTPNPTTPLPAGWMCEREKTYGSNKHLFIRKTSNGE